MQQTVIIFNDNRDMKTRLYNTQEFVGYYIENLEPAELNIISGYLAKHKKTVTEVLRDIDIAHKHDTVMIIDGDLQSNPALRTIVQCALIVAGALNVPKERWRIEGEHLAINIANNGLPADAVRLK
jgi:hypothetical protein